MQIGFLLLNLFYFFTISKSDDKFDDSARDIDKSVYIKISAFRNQKSKGVNKGCCGVRQGRICLPCQFKFELVSQGLSDDPDGHEVEKRTVLGISTKPSDELIENYENSFIFNPFVYNRHKIEVISLQYTSTPQDRFYVIYSYQITKFLFQGTFGENNFIELWSELYLRQITETYDFFTAYIRVDTIYWINFKTIAPQCCAKKQSYECENECNYEIDWNTKDDNIEIASVSPLNNERQVNVSVTITSGDGRLKKRPLSYEIQITSLDQYETIDIVKIPKVEAIPYVEYQLLNARGVYNNIILNVSWMHNCLKSAGINCANTCNSDGVIASCDPITGKPFCLNGAQDFPICETIKSDCKVNPCKNRASCFVDSGKLRCSCLNGYFGNLCENWQCDSRCNGNGICVGPNICNCIPPYIGNDCEGSPCLEEKEKKCGENGNCILIAGIKSCQCTNPLFTGENCSEPICNPECIFGYCRFSKYLGITRCVCNEQYEGVICNITTEKLIQNQSSSSFIIPLVILVLVLIFLIVIFVLTILGKIPFLVPLKVSAQSNSNIK